MALQDDAGRPAPFTPTQVAEHLQAARFRIDLAGVSKSLVDGFSHAPDAATREAWAAKYGKPLTGTVEGVRADE